MAFLIDTAIHKAMISPSHFVASWNKLHDAKEHFCSPLPKVAASRTLPEATRKFLVEAGLPDGAAPCLSFRYVRILARLWEVFAPNSLNLKDRQRLQSYLMIGSDGAGNPICLDESCHGQVVVLDHEDRFKTVMFVNSTIQQLSESLLAYRRLVRDTIAINEDAYFDRKIPAVIWKTAWNTIQEADPAALAEGCFWFHEFKSLETAS